jgi:hypothetical protein
MNSNVLSNGTITGTPHTLNESRGYVKGLKKIKYNIAMGLL